ncbi:MAG: outer membrane beta-barrel protein [Chlorobi bacterium]|nr:outer membrane beta-barrel protein [Chlorobiota bacterium]
MKNLLFIILFFSSINIFSQERVNKLSFTTFGIGAYGGIDFKTSSEIGGEFLLEGKTNLIDNLNLKLSLGYYKTLNPVNYSVKSNGIVIIDSVTYYVAESHDVTKKIYDIFPFALGFQYIFQNKTLSPYLTFDASYNLISPSIEKAGGYVKNYPSYEDIPDEYKVKHVEDNPNNSYGIAIGAGAVYHLSEHIGLDLRYYYKYDSEIVNTHHILVGIVF